MIASRRIKMHKCKLLCVQDRATDRPTVSSVVVKLESGTTAIASLRQPTFAAKKPLHETDTSTLDLKTLSYCFIHYIDRLIGFYTFFIK